MRVRILRNTERHAVAWWPGHGISNEPHAPKFALFSVPFILIVIVEW